MNICPVVQAVGQAGQSLLFIYIWQLQYLQYQEVDVTTTAPIPAFCSSDEEEEDKEVLLYLPIAPEIEDPEDNWVPVI